MGVRIKTVFIFCLVVFLSACSETQFIFLDGKSKKLSDYQEDTLLINYWAVWCKPCLKEIPELNKVNQQKNITVFAFNYDDLDAEVLKEQVRKFDIQYPSILDDPAKIFGQEKPNVLPATMVINRKGVFVEWLYGAQTKEELSKYLDI